jgi:hypothetical protein
MGVAAMTGASTVYRVKCTLVQTGGNDVAVSEAKSEAWLEECPKVQYLMAERGPQFNVELTAGIAIAALAICICFFAFYSLLVSAKFEGDGEAGDFLAGGVMLFQEREDEEDSTQDPKGEAIGTSEGKDGKYTKTKTPTKIPAAWQ